MVKFKDVSDILLLIQFNTIYYIFVKICNTNVMSYLYHFISKHKNDMVPLGTDKCSFFKIVKFKVSDNRYVYGFFPKLVNLVLYEQHI